MKILLLTDMPPCENFTAGIALNHLIRNLSKEQVAICSIVSPDLNPRLPDDLKDIAHLSFTKPKESAFFLYSLKINWFTEFKNKLVQEPHINIQSNISRSPKKTFFIEKFFPRFHGIFFQLMSMFVNIISAICNKIFRLFFRAIRKVLSLCKKISLLPLKLRVIPAFAYEIKQGIKVRYVLFPKIEKYIQEQKIDAVWVVLEGQTLIRLADQCIKKLDLPIYSQVWDPFEWWLRANKIDSYTSRRLLRVFDRVVKNSVACATASPSMAKVYNAKYKIPALSLIVGLPKELMQEPKLEQNDQGEFIIAMAGQFYALNEWNALISTLNNANWMIAGRKIRVRVLGAAFNFYTQKSACIEYLGWQSQKDTIKYLSESNLLYIPYWFSEEFKMESSTSFPSKLVSYFASGRPVFCHAPMYSSPSKYIYQNNAGYLCTSLEQKDIQQMLEHVIKDKDKYAKISYNGTKSFLRDFTLSTTKDNFLKFISYENNTKTSSEKFTQSYNYNSSL